MKREKAFVFVLPCNAIGTHYITVGKTWQQAGQGGQRGQRVAWSHCTCIQEAEGEQESLQAIKLQSCTQ